MGRFNEDAIEIKKQGPKRSFILKPIVEEPIVSDPTPVIIDSIDATPGPTIIKRPEVVTTPSSSSSSSAMIEMIHIDSLKEHRFQSRKRFDQIKLEELSQSISENGVVTPLKVSRVSGGKFEVISGERRLRAARMAGVERLPCIIISEHDGIIQSVIENLQRENLNIFEEGRDYEKLLSEKIFTSQKEMAHKLGVKESRVSEVLSYCRNITPEDQDTLIQEGKTSREALRKFIENKKRTYTTSRSKHISVTFIVTGDTVIARSNSEKSEFNKCLVKIKDEIDKILKEY